MAELQRTLSYPVLLIITINSIMGTGIFFLPAVGARISGTASIFAWLIMSLIALGISLIFAELVGMHPKSGGIYEYTKQAFGTFWSFIFGWITLIAANITIAMLIVGAVRYVNPGLPNTINLAVSIVFVLIFNFMAYRGMRTSAVMLSAFGFITLITLLTLTVPGLLRFEWQALLPFTAGNAAILFTVFLIAETFFGWETATFLAEETKDPERVMPRALWFGTLIIAIISLLFVLVSLAATDVARFAQTEAPLSYLSGIYFGEAAMPVISLLVYLSIIGSVAGWIVSSPRLIMSLAKDRLFIHQLAAVHPTYNTPHAAILFQTTVTSLLIIIGSGSYDRLLELLIPLVLFMYGGVIVSFIILRWRQAHVARPFRVHGGIAIAVALIAVILSLFVGWIHESPDAYGILRLCGSFILMGVPLFLLLTVYYDPQAIIRFNSVFARVSLWFENFLLPQRVRDEILSLFRDLDRKHILDYGAGVGTMTLLLAERVGVHGKVTATDISERNIMILKRRLERRGIAHVRTIHDPHQINRVDPRVREVDAVFSVGMLSYIQDLQKVLREFSRIMPHRGKICFVEYTDFFRVLPNPKWIDDRRQLQEEFRRQGFLVKTTRIRGLFWNYLFIYGEKRVGREADVPFI